MPASEAPKVAKEEPATASAPSSGVADPDKDKAAGVIPKPKEKKKEKKRKAESGVEETPGGKEEAEGKAEGTPEEIRAAKAAPLDPKERGIKKAQEEVDRYVAKHPEDFGLGSISIRGSAAKHFKESDERRREKPAEPVGPPPQRAREERPGDRPGREERPRSRSKPKKSKGENHRKRGREYWRRVREQEKWHRRHPQGDQPGPGRGSRHR